MKSVFVSMVMMICVLAAAGSADFDNLTLAPESYYNGADGGGDFVSGNALFNNSYADYGGGYIYWDGWAYSNKGDTTTPGYGNQFSAITGSGLGGSGNYGIGYPSEYNTNMPKITLLGSSEGCVVDGAYFTNTTYAYLSMLEGDQFAKKFGGTTGDDPDWFMMTVTGFDASGASVGSLDVYLADFCFEDNAQDYILNQWTWVDLSSLGVVKTLEFTLSSSDTGMFGMNTPAYFAMDSLVPEPATLALLGLGAAALRMRRK